MVLKQVTVNGLSVGLGRLQNIIQNFALFIAKQGFQRVPRRFKVLVLDPQNLREIGFFKALKYFFAQALIAFPVHVFPDAAA